MNTTSGQAALDTAAGPAHAEPVPARRSAIGLSRLGLPLVFLGAVLVAAVTTDGFLTGDNIRAVLVLASLTGTTAVGMSAMTISGNFVSLATTQSAMLAAVAFLGITGKGWDSTTVLIGLIVGFAVIGALQGLVVAAGLDPIITTLAVGGIMFGLVSYKSQGRSITFGEHTPGWAGTQWFGLPLQFYLFVVVTVVATVVASKTVLGRELRLVGANRYTAEISGISPRRITVWAFVIASVTAALAGIASASSLGAATVGSFHELTIDAAAAVLIGGIAVQGGFGSPLRAAVGAVIISMLTNVMLLHDLSEGGRQAAVGLAVVFVVFMLRITERKGGAQ